MTKSQVRHWLIACSFALAAVAVATPFANADEVADVAKAIQSGQYADAMQKADAFLAQHPKDAHMRFLKGLIFAEQNKTNDAIDVFTKLTVDYPDLPEPYNNLAVLFASQNQYDKARAALEMAIRTNPSYSTAHENLGDVYAKLASQAYDKALQLDSANSGAKLKLNLIHNLFSTTPSAINTQPAVAAAKTPAPPAKTAPATKPPEVATTVAAAPAPVQPPVTTAQKSNAIKVEPAKVPVARVEPPKPAPVPAPAPAASNGDQDDALKAVNGWAEAWSSKNTSAYLAFYADNFQTPKGQSRSAWAEERRQRIEGKGHISVKIESAQANIDGSTATVRFRQLYSSDQLKADSRKTLVLVKQDGKWLITQERSGG
jgi:tetratricopeptide (TPR) repeat protein